MARLPRLKVENEVGWYHLCARVSGWLNWFPFEDRVARQKLLQTIRKYLAVYCCDAAAFCLMGNHYHLIVRFLPFRILSREELYERARLLYRDPDQVLQSQRQWQRFNGRIFDVSEFMRNVQQSYTKWYNRRYRRRGSLWGERFKSAILGGQQSILDALLYVELNPVRSGLVERPEDWQWSSAAVRALSQDDWLVPLEQLIPTVSSSSCLLITGRSFTTGEQWRRSRLRELSHWRFCGWKRPVASPPQELTSGGYVSSATGFTSAAGFRSKTGLRNYVVAAITLDADKGSDTRWIGPPFIRFVSSGRFR